MSFLGSLPAGAFALAALLPAPPAQTQIELAPPEPLARWVAGEGVTPGVSELVGTWKAVDGGPKLQHEELRSWPRHDALLAAGRAALVFDRNDALSRSSGMPVGSATRAVAFRAETPDAGGLLLGGEGEGLRLVAGSGKLAYDQGGVELVANAAPKTGEFHHAVVTYDAAAGLAEVHLDGALVAAGPVLPPTSTALRVGGPQANSAGFEGAIAELRVYDSALTAAERQAVEAELDVYRDPAFPRFELVAFPRDAAIVPRDPSDRAQVPVEAVVETPGFDAAVLHVRRDGAPYLSLAQPLTYGPDGAPVAFAPTLAAGLHDHTFRLALERDGELVPIAHRERVAVGDVLLIDGQSNAVALDWHDEGLGAKHVSHWVRSFGDARWATAVAPALGSAGLLFAVPQSHAADSNWDLARPLVGHDHASVGQWALRMGELIADVEGVPVGLLNGAAAGTSILHHQRNDAYPTDPRGLYGRLLHRARDAGVDRSARAMIYYQGEADGPLPAFWESTFHGLAEDWQVDYPALERIYVLQIREGCGATNDGLREVQRTLGDVLPAVSVMSTTAAPGHDGCHFGYAGYRELGERMARLVGRDLYGVPALGADAPRIVAAAWEDAGRDAVILTFEPYDTFLTVDAGVTEDLSVDDGTAVTGVTALGGTRVRVQLAGASAAGTITWRGHLKDGPWIQNHQGVGALTFFGFPITP